MTDKKENEFRIIVIDDNPAIHADFVKILAKHTPSEFDKLSMEIFDKKNSFQNPTLPTFLIDAATQGQEGIALIKKAHEQGQSYALAFIDIRMPPGWNGIETIKHVWEIDKDIQVVICTAFSDYSWEDTVRLLGNTDNLLILKKPFDTVAVRQIACSLAQKWKSIHETRKYTSSLKQEIENKSLLLQQSLSLVKATLESSNNGIVVIDNEGVVTDCNQKLLEMWGIPKTRATQKNKINFLELMKDKLLKPKLIAKNMALLLADPEAIRIDVIKLKDGRTFEYYTQPQKVHDKTIGRMFDFRDITKRTNLEEKLLYHATHDQLTGLANRMMLVERLQHEVKKAKQNRTQIALVLLDLDRFKLVNESFSHSVGDELLRTAAMRLKSCIRADDTLARLGGDEFLIVMTDITSQQDVIKKAPGFLEVFEKPFAIADREVVITASIGISIFPQDAENVDDLLKNAEAAMYRAKEKRGNHYQFYSNEMCAINTERLNREMELRQALSNQELYLCYQPEFTVTQEKLVAVEALVRWLHPTAGELLAADFIPLAEQTGLIVQIGEWVLRTACAQCKAWQDLGIPPIRIAVNISEQQFKQQDLAVAVKRILQETELDAHYLELEVSENFIINNPDMLGTLKELKRIGVSLALDHFGTAYSSLSYLHQASLDRLKIDKSFIQHVRNKDDDEVIVRTIIAMAKNLNLEVLAEGVETKNQLCFLRRNDCAEVQGFYFSKPLKKEELEKLLQDYKNIDVSKMLSE